MVKKYFLALFLLSPGAFADKNIEGNFKKKMFKTPLREVSIIVSDDGFYPNKIMAFQGEKVRFYAAQQL